MDPLEELIARDKVRQLAERYALAVDSKDIERIAPLFVEDVNNGRYGPGREGVKTYYDNVLRGFHCSIHVVHNHVMDFDDDHHAHGVVYGTARHHVLDPEYWHDKALAYWDTYERVGDAWFFRRRQVKSWYRQEFGHPERGTGREVSEPGSKPAELSLALPGAFPTFEEFWSRPPRPLPASPAARP